MRAWLPVETYPISAGVKGGLAGSVGMAVLACIYGIVKAGSIWYPINLLAAAVYGQSPQARTCPVLNSFHADSFCDRCGSACSCFNARRAALLGAMLPMFARAANPPWRFDRSRAVVGTAVLDPEAFLNPLLESHIDWFWFIASQIAFGIIAGIVVLRQSRVPTRENLPFVLRAGIEAAGTITPRGNGEKTAVNSFGHLYVLTVAGALLLTGCNLAHGKPGQDSETVAPNEITDFATLYAQNAAPVATVCGRARRRSQSARRSGLSGVSRTMLRSRKLQQAA